MPATSTLPFGNSSAMSSSAPVADATIKLADTPTRLEAMPEKLQERLINWGYLVTDTAMRKHVDTKLSAATAWPFARGVA